MLIDTKQTIAYKCSSCGTYDFFNISLFSFSGKSEKNFACRCSKSSMTIAEKISGCYKIRIPCIACGKSHTFVLTRKQMFHSDVKVFYCPQTGMQQCFIGNDTDVRKKIDSLEKELDELIDMFGYDNYFKNTRVMFDALNKIHDIAEQGNLYCECGNNDIELTLLSDKIHLKCRKCPGSMTIEAASNEDLKGILMRQQMLLMNNYPKFNINQSKPFMRKTDGK